jgi:hypothetical protein
MNSVRVENRKRLTNSGTYVVGFETGALLVWIMNAKTHVKRAIRGQGFTR